MAVKLPPHVTPHVKSLISIMIGEMPRMGMQDKLKLSDRMNFLNNYLQPALNDKVLKMTIPDKPKSSNQKYKLTELGLWLKDN